MPSPGRSPHPGVEPAPLTLRGVSLPLAPTGKRRQWHPLQCSCWRSPGTGSLVGCGPWGGEESDTTERRHSHFSLSCIGEGNGTHSSALAWRSPGTGSLLGCRLWGRTESDTTEAPQQQHRPLGSACLLWNNAKLNHSPRHSNCNKQNQKMIYP